MARLYNPQATAITGRQRASLFEPIPPAALSSIASPSTTTSTPATGTVESYDALAANGAGPGVAGASGGWGASEKAMAQNRENLSTWGTPGVLQGLATGLIAGASPMASLVAAGLGGLSSTVQASGLSALGRVGGDVASSIMGDDAPNVGARHFGLAPTERSALAGLGTGYQGSGYGGPLGGGMVPHDPFMDTLGVTGTDPNRAVGGTGSYRDTPRGRLSADFEAAKETKFANADEGGSYPGQMAEGTVSTGPASGLIGPAHQGPWGDPTDDWGGDTQGSSAGSGFGDTSGGYGADGGGDIY